MLTPAIWPLGCEHASLQWPRNFKNTEGQVTSWQENLQEYQFQRHHRAGRKHQNADSASRRPTRNHRLLNPHIGAEDGCPLAESRRCYLGLKAKERTRPSVSLHTSKRRGKETAPRSSEGPQSRN